MSIPINSIVVGRRRFCAERYNGREGNRFDVLTTSPAVFYVKRSPFLNAYGGAEKQIRTPKFFRRVPGNLLAEQSLPSLGRPDDFCPAHRAHAPALRRRHGRSAVCTRDYTIGKGAGRFRPSGFADRICPVHFPSSSFCRQPTEMFPSNTPYGFV